MASPTARFAAPIVAAPKYPWRVHSPLRTHDFVDESDDHGPMGMRVFACRSCGRRFMYDPGMHETWAIARDAKSSPLQDSVSSRWVAQRCTGKVIPADEKDAKRIKVARGSRRAPSRAEGAVK